MHMFLGWTSEFDSQLPIFSALTLKSQFRWVEFDHNFDCSNSPLLFGDIPIFLKVKDLSGPWEHDLD